MKAKKKRERKGASKGNGGALLGSSFDDHVFNSLQAMGRCARRNGWKS